MCAVTTDAAQAMEALVKMQLHQDQRTPSGRGCSVSGVANGSTPGGGEMPGGDGVANGNEATTSGADMLQQLVLYCEVRNGTRAARKLARRFEADLTPSQTLSATPSFSSIPDPDPNPSKDDLPLACLPWGPNWDLVLVDDIEALQALEVSLRAELETGIGRPTISLDCEWDPTSKRAPVSLAQVQPALPTISPLFSSFLLFRFLSLPFTSSLPLFSCSHLFSLQFRFSSLIITIFILNFACCLCFSHLFASFSYCFSFSSFSVLSNKPFLTDPGGFRIPYPNLRHVSPLLHPRRPCQPGRSLCPAVPILHRHWLRHRWRRGAAGSLLPRLPRVWDRVPRRGAARSGRNSARQGYKRRWEGLFRTLMKFTLLNY